MRTTKCAWMRVAALLLALLCALPLLGCRRGSDVPLSPGLSMIKGEPVYDNNVAMRTDHFTVTPGMMAFFFYDYGGTLMQRMEQNKPFDNTKSLHEQIYEDTLSWYDVIMNATLERVCELLIYCEGAYAAGVTLTDAQRESLEQEIYTIKFDAAAAYSMSGEEYLQALYGPLVNEAELRRVLEVEMLASTYATALTKELEAGITRESIEAYAAANGLDDSSLSRNITYISIPYVGGAANEAQVNAVLAALRNAPIAQTVEGFSANGTVGSEQDLTPDNTGLAKMKDWLFASGRTVGDFDRVEIGSATYVLLYTGNGMRYGLVSARMRLYDAAFANWYNARVEQLTFGYNYDIIDGYDVK